MLNRARCSQDDRCGGRRAPGPQESVLLPQVVNIDRWLNEPNANTQAIRELRVSAQEAFTLHRTAVTAEITVKRQVHPSMFLDHPSEQQIDLLGSEFSRIDPAEIVAHAKSIEHGGLINGLDVEWLCTLVRYGTAQAVGQHAPRRLIDHSP